jgi:hypothetical protein
MITVANLIRRVGHAKMAKSINASESALSNMKKINRFPSKKYRLVCIVCADLGVGMPPDTLFAFEDARRQKV